MVDAQFPPVIDIGDWDGQPIPARQWIVDDMIPYHVVTMLTGDGGLGKSTLALQLAVSSVAEKPWLGRTVKSVNVLVVACEDDADELHRRCYSVLDSLGLSFGDLAGHLRIISAVGYDNVLVEYEDFNSRGKRTKFCEFVQQEAQKFGAQLIILDSLHDFFAGNENLRPQARQFINHLRDIAVVSNGAVLLLAHPSVAGIASGDGRAGSTAWHNTVRSRLYLVDEKKDDRDDSDLKLKNNKANYGPRGLAIPLVYKDGVFIATDTTRKADPVYRKAAADTVFLDCLRERLSQGRPVSQKPKASNYAPREFVKMRKPGGWDMQDLAAAMERLFADKRIKVESYRDASRNLSQGIVDVAPIAPAPD